MWNEPKAKDLATIPGFYETENIPAAEKMIHAHFFVGGSDWYVAEYDPKSRMFFGYVILNNDYDMAEWGYFSLAELVAARIPVEGRFGRTVISHDVEVDRDLYWEVRPASEVENIRRACGWMLETA